MRRIRVPHTLVLLMGGIVLAAALTHVVPAGEYARRTDEATGRQVVQPGTYHTVPASPAGVMDLLRAVPRGIGEAADVIAVVFLVGAAFAVVDRTGALRAAFAALVRRLGTRAWLAIPLCCLLFAAGGALENMQEEIIALVPALVLLAARVGGNPLTAVAMSLGSAVVGAAFSPVNPFQVGIAQQIVGIPMFSGFAFRLALLAVALAVWMWAVLRQARSVTGAPLQEAEAPADAWSLRFGLVMACVAGGFAVFLVGQATSGWGFDELSAVFLAVGLLAGLAGGLGPGGTASAFVDGFREMAFAALLIGFARGIFVVLNDGHVIDTIVRALATPLDGLPPAVAVAGMVGLQTLVHVPVPSVSGQAVLTLPILAPLSDLLQISRQVTVLAYQTGAGMCDLITPTNGALMAMLSAAGVRYDQWLRFALPFWAALAAFGTVGALLALAVGVV
ncbi:MAG: Na+/H+ antiporter NhaC family protein [Vicinamibacterales bacterium]